MGCGKKWYYPGRYEKRNGAKLKDNGVNAVGMKDVKRENSQKGNTKGKNARIKDARNKSYLNPEEDPRFHDTYKSLRRYRDATYSLKVVVHQMEKQFRLKYGTIPSMPQGSNCLEMILKSGQRALN